MIMCCLSEHHTTYSTWEVDSDNVCPRKIHVLQWPWIFSPSLDFHYLVLWAYTLPVRRDPRSQPAQLTWTLALSAQPEWRLFQRCVLSCSCCLRSISLIPPLLPPHRPHRTRARTQDQQAPRQRSRRCTSHMEVCFGISFVPPRMCTTLTALQYLFSCLLDYTQV